MNTASLKPEFGDGVIVMLVLRSEEKSKLIFFCCNPYGVGHGMITQNFRLLPLKGVVVLYIMSFFFKFSYLFGRKTDRQTWRGRKGGRKNPQQGFEFTNCEIVT